MTFDQLGINDWAAICNGAGDFDHLGTLCGAVETAIEMCKNGIGANVENELLDALDAIAACQQRGRDKGRVLFAGREIGAINEALELHVQQLQVATSGEILRAIAAVKARTI